ncbi:MAG: GIY-YIG nuclease family protein [Solirubrobacteraceae bacterium]
MFRGLGSKAALATKLADYCRGRPDLADVVELLGPQLNARSDAAGVDPRDGQPNGYVYLVRSGRYYKIGSIRDVGRRTYDLAIQLPEKVTRVHAIATDDSSGIERYWHTRFADCRKNGEWFELSKPDIAAFKRRKFM